MKKTVSLFQRNYDGDRLVRDEIVPGAEWVAAGEGVATRKFDGTCCMVRDGKLFKRFDAKAGKKPPENFEPAQEAPDANTGHWPGWVPVCDGPDDARHREAWNRPRQGDDGTYELCGPKVQKNPEGFDCHVLVKHGAEVLHDCPRTFDALREYLSDGAIEGVVWWHPDGRLVKIKGKDFGIKRKPANAGGEATGAAFRDGPARWISWAADEAMEIGMTTQWPVRLEIKRHLAPKNKWHWCVVFNGGHIYAVSDTFESAETCMADAAGAGLDALHGAEMCLTPNA